MIFNVRGTNGSGKTSTVRELLRLLGGWDDEVIQLSPQIAAKVCVSKSHGVCAIGKYSNVCGGCDNVATQDIICDAIRTAATRYQHVIFEGVVVSTIYSRYADLALELGPLFWWVYMTTPVETCLERIQTRNGGKTINVKLVEDKFRSILRTRERALQDGFCVVDFDNYRKAAKWLLNKVKEVNDV